MPNQVWHDGMAQSVATDPVVMAKVQRTTTRAENKKTARGTTPQAVLVYFVSSDYM